MIESMLLWLVVGFGLFIVLQMVFDDRDPWVP